MNRPRGNLWSRLARLEKHREEADRFTWIGADGMRLLMFKFDADPLPPGTRMMTDEDTRYLGVYRIPDTDDRPRPPEDDPYGLKYEHESASRPAGEAGPA